MPVAGATVQLFQGSVQIGITLTTDANGEFMLSGVADGLYSLVITSVTDKGRITVGIHVSGENLNLGKLTLPRGDKNAVLSVSAAVLPVIADGLSGLLTNLSVIDSAMQQFD